MIVLTGEYVPAAIEIVSPAALPAIAASKSAVALSITTLPVTVTVTVAVFESSVPSFALKVKVSVPVKPALGV